MINEISHAYSDYQQGRSTNYDSDDSDDGRSRSSCRSKVKQNSNSSISTSKNKEEGELDDDQEDDNYLDKIIGDGEKVGPQIQEKVAQAITKVLGLGLSADSQEKLKEKYHTPINCPRLVVTKCNSELFKNLNKQTSMNDLKYQKLQSLLIKSLTANVYVYNSLQLMCKGSEPIDRSDLKKEVDSLADAMSLQAHVSKNIDNMRRLNIRPEVADEFGSLCNDEVPPDSTLLFGDLVERMKVCTDTGKITKRVGLQRFRYKQRFHPFGVRGSSVSRWRNRNQSQQYKQNGRNFRNNYKSYNYNRSDSFKISKTQKK